MRTNHKTTCVLCFAAIAFSTTFASRADAPTGDAAIITQSAVRELRLAALETTGAREAALSPALDELRLLPRLEQPELAPVAEEPLLDFGIAPAEVPLLPACWNTDDLDEPSLASMRPLVDRVEAVLVGIASFYFDPQKTASGEWFDGQDFTAAAQLEIRNHFGGIRYGVKYRPAYGVAEYEGKKLILKFNDVGPLRPGRKFDLSRAAMAFFDGSLKKGLLPEFKVTPLPLGRDYQVGPISDADLVALRSQVLPCRLSRPARPRRLSRRLCSSRRPRRAVPAPRSPA